MDSTVYLVMMGMSRDDACSQVVVVCWSPLEAAARVRSLEAMGTPDDLWDQYWVRAAPMSEGVSPTM